MLFDVIDAKIVLIVGQPAIGRNDLPDSYCNLLADSKKGRCSNEEWSEEPAKPKHNIEYMTVCGNCHVLCSVSYLSDFCGPCILHIFFCYSALFFIFRVLLFFLSCAFLHLSSSVISFRHNVMLRTSGDAPPHKILVFVLLLSNLLIASWC